MAIFKDDEDYEIFLITIRETIQKKIVEPGQRLKRLRNIVKRLLK